MLFDSPYPFFRVAWEVILVVVVITVAFFVFAIGMAVKTYRRKPTTGQQGMIGEIGEVYKAIDQTGTVKIHGEYWTAFSDSPIEVGKQVEVIEYDGQHLKIKVKAI